ncbi:hypothetical protein ACN26Z_01590 [Verrucosispora sp. WMMD703]
MGHHSGLAVHHLGFLDRDAKTESDAPVYTVSGHGLLRIEGDLGGSTN